jgi:hypothetical protein
VPKSLRFVLWSLVASVLGFAMLTHHSSAAGSREDFPAKLSQWKLIQRAGDRLAAAPSGVTYERSEERRVGKECRRLCRSRWSPYH